MSDDLACPRLTVFCTLRFEATHRWPGAAAHPGVRFLANEHRHLFHARCEWAVSHDDRDVEFLLARRRAEGVVRSALLDEDTGTWSCERWALRLFGALGCSRVEVSEDGENGAVVTA